MRVLILCTGNSCRSQMAEGFLRSFDPSLNVFSAGTHPASQVHPMAVAVMKEAGLDIHDHVPRNVDQFIDLPFDYLITVCGGARERCPVFSGRVQHRIHIGFDDPAEATGTDVEKLIEFRRVRDEIKEQFFNFFKQKLQMNY